MATLNHLELFSSFGLKSCHQISHQASGGGGGGGVWSGVVLGVWVVARGGFRVGRDLESMGRANRTQCGGGGGGGGCHHHHQQETTGLDDFSPRW